jgi:hypothetical protein
MIRPVCTLSHLGRDGKRKDLQTARRGSFIKTVMITLPISMLGKYHHPSYINSSLLRELFICFYSVAWSVGEGREKHADDTRLVCCFVPVQMQA